VTGTWVCVLSEGFYGMNVPSEPAPQGAPVPTIVLLLESYGVHIPDHPDAGGWFRVRCPWHTDHKASAGISKQRNRFHCHATSCGVKGTPEELPLLSR
jgi:hypothetical protein